jgi:hypothetical protein
MNGKTTLGIELGSTRIKAVQFFTVLACFLLLTCNTSTQGPDTDDPTIPLLPDADPDAAYIYTADFSSAIDPRFTPTADHITLDAINKDGGKGF